MEHMALFSIFIMDLLGMKMEHMALFSPLLVIWWQLVCAADNVSNFSEGADDAISFLLLRDTHSRYGCNYGVGFGLGA